MLNLRHPLVIQWDVGQQATRLTGLESGVQVCTPDINLGVFRVQRTFLPVIMPEMTLGEEERKVEDLGLSYPRRPGKEPTKRLSSNDC